MAKRVSEDLSSQPEGPPAERMRYNRIRRGQTRLIGAASRTDGTESERCPRPGGRYRRNAHGSLSAVPAALCRTLAGSNVIESAFSVVETDCRNLKRWRSGDHVEGWIGSGLLVAERSFARRGRSRASVAVDGAGERGFDQVSCRRVKVARYDSNHETRRRTAVLSTIDKPAEDEQDCVHPLASFRQTFIS
jgi:hypothetical protein